MFFRMKYFTITVVLFMLSSCGKKKGFSKIESKHSGIHFNNLIEDNDTLNVLDIENIYNGGGVGIGDFNNDGLQDIYFTGNTVSNKLYINNGELKFTDVTDAAGVSGEGKWSRGASVVDINNDGLLDIYVCATILPDSIRRENLLYINKGNNNKGIPQFTNMAAAYGLNDPSHSTMAAFFDYDNDGDLDMYLLINEIKKQEFPNKFRPVFKNRENPNTDKLFRNDWNDSLQHPVFTDVSALAGITIEGYGHGVTVCDINKDGWKDVYVTNDFMPANILYINNKNGTFSNKEQEYFKHTSSNAMGQDVIDINNDGLADVIELDMNPEDNYRKKTMLSPIAYHKFQLSDLYGLQYQYIRNTLQINQGPCILENDTIGHPVFSDIGYLAGIAETDWSWTPLVADFDNDTYRDIIITNGFPKDVTDNDFMAFRNKAIMLMSKSDLLDQIPEVKIANYAFKNEGGLNFSNVSTQWGLTDISFSNGAAWADLDNDGDLDWVVNNINGEAFLYKNNLDNKDKNYLQVKFKGDSLNINGLGAFAELHYDKDKIQIYETSPYRGYLSSVQNIAHFGLGKTSVIDSLVVTWPTGKKQVIKQVKTNQVITADIAAAVPTMIQINKTLAEKSLFRELTSAANINYIHSDSDFVDFNIQRLLPHKFSEYGPALAVGDIDGNGLDDLIAGGSYYYQTQFFLQQPEGRFIQSKEPIRYPFPQQPKQSEDLGILLFDADSDGDNDLYIASGGYEGVAGSISYKDKFYLNDGKGRFFPDSTAFPINFISKSCVRTSDFDKDGDLDLMIAGRVDPRNYPKPVSSFIYRNDSKNGLVKFSDVTETVAKDLLNIGMICDAIFTDFDNDGWDDMVLAGEWMPATFLKNNKGVFQNINASTGIQWKTGWWTSIAPGDFDNDGDMDYIAGNLGLNSFYKASEKYPVSITSEDFDKNGSSDALLSVFLPISAKQPERKEFIVHLRDEVISQLPSTRKLYPDYRSFATVNFNDFLSGFKNTDNDVRQTANYLQSSIILNNGNGKFTIRPLPVQAQFSALNGMAVEDFDGDGNLDVAINGNDFGTEVFIGRYDAMNGLLLKGDGAGNFRPLSILESGIYIPGNGKALAMLQSFNNKCLLAASQNRGPLKILQLKKEDSCIRFSPEDASALIKYKNGKLQKREINYGSSYLSQSGRFILSNENMQSIEILNRSGNKRVVNFR
jgi:hypothetical protein